jgi:hypothetical protein
MIKITTPITEKKGNGGMHSVVNYRKAMDMLTNHPYKHGRLYHITLTGSEERTIYRKVLDRLCKELRTNGMPVMWKACYERDEKKRFHMHIFLLIECHTTHADSVMHYRKGNFLDNLTKSNGLAFTIAEPDNPMHYVAGKQVNSMYVPKNAGPKLDDCLIWISYLFKARSKADVGGQIYTSSTNRGSAKPTIH